MAELNDDFWQDENRRLRRILSPLIRAAALAGAEWAFDDLGVLAAGLDWGLVNKAVVAWAQEYTGDLVDGITMTSRLFVKEQIVRWIEGGQPLDDLIDALTPMFGEVRAGMIGVTEVTRTFAEGNIATWRESGVVSGKQWMTARDELVCEICAPLAGQIVELNSDGFTTESGDEALGLYAPPAHVNCLPGDTPVLPIGGVATGSKRNFEGDLIVIVTPENHLSITPNHPILTTSGWVAAGELQQGDYVIAYNPVNREATRFGIDNHEPIASIEDIFCSIGLIDFRMPTSAPDFHGDGMNDEIAVIRPNSEIRNKVNSNFIEPFAKLGFVPGAIEISSMLGRGTAAKFVEISNPTSGGIMGGVDLPLSRLFVHPRPFESFGLRLTAGGDTCFDEALSESPSINADFISEKIFGITGQITLQEIIEIRNINFSGHVYNLETESGMFVASGIITHNCRCYLQPFVTVE